MLEALTQEVTKLVKASTPLATEPIDNPNGDGKYLVVRDGYKVQTLEGRRKSARVHIFDDLGSFADWMNRHATEDAGPAADDKWKVKGKTSVEILVSENQACALLDPSNPASDCVTSPLDWHPLFEAWRTVFGKQMNQAQFYAFIRGAGESFEADVGASLSGQLLKLKTNGVNDLELELDETGFAKLAGHSQTATISAKLPGRFQILVPMIDGVRNPDDDSEKRYVIDVLLSIEMKKVEGAPIPLFTVAAPSLPLLEHRARIDAALYLKSLLAPGFLVGLGTIQTKAVPA